jgi:hypothetical protein
MIATPDQALWGIRYRAERLVDDGEDALRSVLETDDDGVDSPDARQRLTAAVHMAKELVPWLDKRYEFDGETATLKEQSCG